MIVRAVSRSGRAVAEFWTGSGWAPGGSLGDTLEGRSIELSADELDKAGIPREDAEGPDLA